MYSIVTANRNRLESLIQVLPSWQAASLVSEIVVVDHGSERPIALTDFADRAKVKIVRVTNPEDWRLGLAANLGVDQTTNDLICKLDSDIELKRAAWLGEIDPATGFYRGNFRAGIPNGEVIFAKRHWAAVGGHNEWLPGYGFDDTDFYIRLRNSGVTQRFIEPGVIEERAHSHEMRTGREPLTSWFDVDVTDPQARLLFSSSRNTYLAYLARWSPARRRAYTSKRVSDSYVEIELAALSAEYRRLNAFAEYLTLVRMHGDPKLVEALGSLVGTFLSEDGGL
jgi:glycosyltransferase involved in cell wall biosynthesis